MRRHKSLLFSLMLYSLIPFVTACPSSGGNDDDDTIVPNDDDTLANDDDTVNDDDDTIVDDDDTAVDDDDTVINDDDIVDDDDVVNDDDIVDDDDDTAADDDDTVVDDPFDSVPLEPEPVMLAGGPGEAVEILYDQRGVPHVYGKTIADALYGLGFCHARDRGFQLDELRRTALGRMAELLPNALSQDVQFRALDMPRLAQRALDALTPEQLTWLESYSAGVNAVYRLLRDDPARAGELGLRLDTRYGSAGFGLEAWEDWQPRDTLAVMMLYLFSLSFDLGDLDRSEISAVAAIAFNGTPLEDFGQDINMIAPARQTPVFEGGSAPKVRRSKVSGSPAVSTPISPGLEFDTDALRERLRELFGDPVRGTNAWAVHGSHTASGHPILATDPHLALDLPPMFYQAHLNTAVLGEGGVNLAGFGIPGMPLFYNGVNDEMAFALVASQVDVTDVWQENLVSDDPLSVEWEGTEIVLDQREEIFHLADGTTHSDNLFVHPVRGPIVQINFTGGAALSVGWNGHRTDANDFGAWWNTQTAGSAGNLISSIRQFGTGSLIAVGAFASGDIAAALGGAIPVREQFMPNYWHTPWLVMPGPDEAAWQGFVDPALLPSVLDPPSGWIVAANQDPIGATGDGFPLNDGLYLGAYFNEGHRAARIDTLLGSTGPQDFATTRAIQTDIYDPLAPTLVPALIEAIDANPLGLASGDARVEQARQLLASWDYRSVSGMRWDEGSERFVTDGVSNAERDASVATTIFSTFVQALYELVFGDEEEAANVGAGSGAQRRMVLALIERPEVFEVPAASYYDDIATGQVELQNERFVSALLRALDELTFAPMEDGSLSANLLDWRWGRFHRVTLDAMVPGEALPLDGTGYAQPGNSDSVARASFSNSCCGRFVFGSGASARLMVELDPDGAHRIRSILPGGQSTHIVDAHRADQLPQWLNGEDLSAPFVFDDVVEDESESWLQLVHSP